MIARHIYKIQKCFKLIHTRRENYRLNLDRRGEERKQQQMVMLERLNWHVIGIFRVCHQP